MTLHRLYKQHHDELKPIDLLARLQKPERYEKHSAPDKDARAQGHVIRKRGVLDTLAAALNVQEAIQRGIEPSEKDRLRDVFIEQAFELPSLQEGEARGLVDVTSEVAKLLRAQKRRELLPRILPTKAQPERVAVCEMPVDQGAMYLFGLLLGADAGSTARCDEGNDLAGEVAAFVDEAPP